MSPELQDMVLRVSVRHRIEHGRLPAVQPKQILAGYGTGRLCAVCDQPITSAQAEYLAEDFERDRQLCFHSLCHAAWQSECSGQ